MRIPAPEPSEDCGADRNQCAVPVGHSASRELPDAIIACLLSLPRCGTGGQLRIRPSQTRLRFGELTPYPKECCETSCGGRKWRGSSRYPARLPHPPTSGQRIRLSTASKLILR